MNFRKNGRRENILIFHAGASHTGINVLNR